MHLHCLWIELSESDPTSGGGRERKPRRAKVKVTAPGITPRPTKSSLMQVGLRGSNSHFTRVGYPHRPAAHRDVVYADETAPVARAMTEPPFESIFRSLRSGCDPDRPGSGGDRVSARRFVRRREVQPLQNPPRASVQLHQGVVHSRCDPDAPGAFDEVGGLLAEPDRLDGLQTLLPICESSVPPSPQLRDESRPTATPRGVCPTGTTPTMRFRLGSTTTSEFRGTAGAALPLNARESPNAAAATSAAATTPKTRSFRGPRRWGAAWRGRDGGRASSGSCVRIRRSISCSCGPGSSPSSSESRRRAR